MDDSEETRLMYAEMLTVSGLRVAHAVDGEHALWKAFASPPDLIVMDLAMPVLDGWAATRELKRRISTSQVPVIVLTGHSTEEHLRRAAEAGADVVLVKPCLPSDLLEAIRSLLARRG